MARKRGSLNARTNSFIRAVDSAEGNDLLTKFSAMAADQRLPLRLRLDACRYLSGALHGRVRLHPTAKAQINANLATT
jgi:hypothetical protein